MTNTLFDGLFANANPAAPCIHSANGATMTYADVMAASARAANVLVERGVQPGDRVAVQVGKSVEALTLYLGTVRVGAVFLPLNTAYTAAEIAYFVGDAEPRLLICDPKNADAYASMATIETLGADGGGTLGDAMGSASDTFESVARDVDYLAAILYTSGTTGRSKGAMLTHRNLLSNAETLVEEWRFAAADVLLHALPIFHTHGLFVASNTVLRSGGSMIFLPKFDADTVLAHLPAATSMMGVPTFYTRLLAHDGFTREAAGHMRLFTSGSAPLLAETHKAFEARTGHRILERYGMTETNMNTSNPYDGDRRAGTVGYPLPGVDLRICEPETTDEVAPGEIGVIEVRGHNVFKGYWRMPEKTAEELREDGFFITGDLGILDADGYVTIVGRGKDLIITGGFNVYPKEIETALDRLDGVEESAVIGVPHPDFGEGVLAVVVPQAGATPDPAALSAALAETLAKFKQPKHIFIAEELPRNTMGKVQKNVLRETHKDVFA